MDDKCIINPERDCIGKMEAIKLENRIKILEDWKDSSKEFHETFYNYQRNRIEHDTKVDANLKTMEENLKKIISWQEEQKTKPEKRWELIITAIITGIIGFVLARFGF